MGGLANTENAEESWLKEGTQTLAIRMAETFKENILLNSPVEKVEQSNGTVTVFVHGQKWKARRLIVTVPLNVLHQIAFEPALPTEWHFVF